jgi:hypothetical protein
MGAKIKKPERVFLICEARVKLCYSFTIGIERRSGYQLSRAGRESRTRENFATAKFYSRKIPTRGARIKKPLLVFYATLFSNEVSEMKVPTFISERVKKKRIPRCSASGEKL